MRSLWAACASRRSFLTPSRGARYDRDAWNIFGGYSIEEL